VLSFGDLILAVGLCDVTFHASRPVRRRGRAAGRAQYRVPEPAAPALAERERIAVPAGAAGTLDVRRPDALPPPPAPRPAPPEPAMAGGSADDGDARATLVLDDLGERVDDDRVVRVYRS
jgi:hypothetical protein